MKKLLLIVGLLIAVACCGVACRSDVDDPSDTTLTSADSAVTESPTEEGTDGTTETPTEVESETPAETPTEAPTEVPTEAPTDAPAETFTVSFFVSGNVGSQPIPQNVVTGEHAKPPVVSRPDDGSSFNGWYTSPSLSPESKFDFTTPITQHITLFAVITAPEDTPVDGELQPALVIDPAFLASQAAKKDTFFSSEISSAAVKTEYDRTFVRLTPDTGGVGDPYVAAIPVGWGTSLPRYMAISYRNSTQQVGEFFMGSGEGWTGQGDSFRVVWTTHGDWSLMILDTTQMGLTSITDGVINYCRLDFFTMNCGEGESFDVEYVAFFHSPMAAELYDESLHTAPDWSTAGDAIPHISFDQLYAGTGEATSGPENVFVPGSSHEWDGTVVYPDHSVETLTYWGWVAVKGAVGSFGYRIGLSAPVFQDSFAYVTEQPVIDSAIHHGGDTGARYKIAIPLTGLKGIHTVSALYRTPDGKIYTLGKFTLQLPGETQDSQLTPMPPKPSYHTVDMATLAGQPGYADVWAEARIPTPHVKLGYNCVVALGRLDLSLYSSVRITYCCDGSETTANAFADASSLAIGLKSQASTYGQVTEDNFSGDLAHTDMVFWDQGWYAGARDAVIDLTDVRYEGDVWVAVHSPASTEIAILGIEFTRRPDADLPEADLLNVQAVDGLVKDISPMGFGVMTAGTPTVIQGYEGPAMSFNRDGAYRVEIGSLYHVLADGFTMETTFTTGDDVTAYENLCANMQAGGFGFDYENGQLSFCLKADGQPSYVCATAPISPNTTYHAVGVYDAEGGKLLIYLNGILAGSTDFTGSPLFAVKDDLAIGGDTGEGANPEYLCDADIYFVRLYSRPLNAETVALLCAYR
jgi:hypothetical protein